MGSIGKRSEKRENNIVNPQLDGNNGKKIKEWQWKVWGFCNRVKRTQARENIED